MVNKKDCPLDAVLKKLKEESIDDTRYFLRKNMFFRNLKSDIKFCWWILKRKIRKIYYGN